MAPPQLIKGNGLLLARATSGCPRTTRFASEALPVRKGARPKTIIGPLHVQCNGHGDPKYLNQLLSDVLSWPHIEPATTSANHLDKVSIRLKEIAVTEDSSAFINGTEFGRVLLASPTIILVLPLVCAQWAMVKGWAEPHYLQSFGLMPAGTVIVYTPKNRVELEVCYSLFFESYHFACKSVGNPPITQNL
jgi:hypothetical protein